MRLAKHFISFHSEFNKFNNTGAGVLYSIYHKTLNCFNMISNINLKDSLDFFPFLTNSKCQSSATT